MPNNTVDPGKTALLFFDMLNAYFRGASEENQRKMEPVVANCVKIRAAASEFGIPVFYAKADHRADGLDAGGSIPTPATTWCLGTKIIRASTPRIARRRLVSGEGRSSTI